MQPTLCYYNMTFMHSNILKTVDGTYIHLNKIESISDLLPSDEESLMQILVGVEYAKIRSLSGKEYWIDLNQLVDKPVHYKREEFLIALLRALLPFWCER